MRRTLNIFSLFSSLGILIWLSTDFYGGMVIYGLMYWWLIIPIVFTFVVTLIVTISRIIKTGFRNNIFNGIIHSFVITILLIFNIYNSELFKSEIVLEAILIDDLSSISIKLRENKTFDTNVSGMLGYTEKISGEYHLQGDTIIFHQSPYNNDFILKTVVIDRYDSAIYFNRNNNGEFIRKKSFVNYFEIRKNKL